MEKWDHLKKWEKVKIQVETTDFIERIQMLFDLMEGERKEGIKFQIEENLRSNTKKVEDK